MGKQTQLERAADFVEFESWLKNLPLQTLTDELKEDILERAWVLTDL